jgi:hypothetical protein
MALKTPAGLLLLMILAAARVRPSYRFTVICATMLVVTWAMLIRSQVNIGVRYALVTYPLAIPFVAQLFERKSLRDRVWAPVVCIALFWFVWASVGSHPRYLSYFNELGGGPSQGWLYLSDSNIDWGQDYDAMLSALKKRGIHEVTTAVFSFRVPHDPDVRVTAIPANAPIESRSGQSRSIPQSSGSGIPITTRYVALSITRLNGFYSPGSFHWLFTRRLVERVGDSIFIFDMDAPAEHPLIP